MLPSRAVMVSQPHWQRHSPTTASWAIFIIALSSDVQGLSWRMEKGEAGLPNLPLMLV